MIHVFKPVPVAYEVRRVSTLSATALTAARDTVTLGWEDRLKIRARRRSTGGVDFAMALPRGTVLREGDCFVFETPPLVIVVVECEEPVLVVHPRAPREWALFAYHIGNSHQPVMLTEAEIICVASADAEQVLSYHGIPFVRAHRGFTPVGQRPSHHHEGPS